MLLYDCVRSGSEEVSKTTECITFVCVVCVVVCCVVLDVVLCAARTWKIRLT